jgi:hypothetical protein
VATVWCRSILSEASNEEWVSELHVLSTIKARAITFDIIDLICNCSTVTGTAIRMSEVRATLSKFALPLGEKWLVQNRVTNNTELELIGRISRLYKSPKLANWLSTMQNMLHLCPSVRPPPL